MENPTAFYNEQLKHFIILNKAIKKKLMSLSGFRVLTFLATAIGIYYTFGSWKIALGIGVFGTAIFLWLLSKYTDLKYDSALTKALLKINKEELNITSKGYYHRDDGRRYIDSNHYYSFDIDLYGKGSLFQYLNRTTSQEGAKCLVNLFNSNTIEGIKDRQDAIVELASKPKWIQQYSAIGSLVDVETPANSIIEWLKHYKPFIPKIVRWLPIAFGLASVLIIVLCAFQIMPLEWIGFWLLLGLAVTGRYLKSINKLALHTDKVKDTFKHYALLLGQIEQASFSSSLLKEKHQKIQKETTKASVIFKALSKHMDALDNRNNLLSAVLGNGFLLWDIMQSYRIEHWIVTYAQKVEDWFEVISFFDAYNSLGTFAFNHPDYVYPSLIEGSAVIDAKDLGHPLLDASKRIASDLKIDKEQFFIVTGANMAGKSTFLRTVSLHIVMANVGLPVCALKSNYTPVKLITSMRTNDSLTDESSYFFSELTRLKFIVDQIEQEDYFIVLDEILKGTNSTDKAIGSRKFVEKLVGTNATGIIATHDLSLCEIEDELKEVKNYYFDAEIVNDELFFDYKLKQGVCQNMNASFLLKKMKIVE